MLLPIGANAVQTNPIVLRERQDLVLNNAEARIGDRVRDHASERDGLSFIVEMLQQVGKCPLPIALEFLGRFVSDDPPIVPWRVPGWCIHRNIRGGPL